MKSILLFAASCLVLAGCSPGVLGTSSPSPGEVFDSTHWRLEVTGDNTGIFDPNHLEFGFYPGDRALEIAVAEDFTICAHDGNRAFCGSGPRIPYLVMFKRGEREFCGRVVDIYGNLVTEGCTEVLSISKPGAVEEHQLAPQGQGGSGAAQPSGTLDEPSGGETGGDQATGDQATGEQGSGGADTGGQNAVDVGVRLVIDEVNRILREYGLESQVTAPEGNVVGSGDWEMSRSSTCEDVRDYLDSEFSDDHVGTDDYYLDERAMAQCIDDGECRVDQWTTRAAAEACDLAEGLSLPQDEVEAGIVIGGGAAIGQLCDEDNAEIEKCVGSPLVLDLAGDGLQLQGLAGGATFALLGDEALAVGWLSGSDDALLAVDLDGDGAIDSGRELFGQGTGGWASDGFAALARHDADKDGVISASDPIFARLLAWRDDGDGRSTPEELWPLSALGIERISLAAHPMNEVDVFGNRLGLRSAAEGAAGSVPVIDVWFRLQGRR